MTGVARELTPHGEGRLPQVGEPPVEDPDRGDPNDTRCVGRDHEPPGSHPDAQRDDSRDAVHESVDRVDDHSANEREAASQQRVGNDRRRVHEKDAGERGRQEPDLVAVEVETDERRESQRDERETTSGGERRNDRRRRRLVEAVVPLDERRAHPGLGDEGADSDDDPRRSERAEDLRACQTSQSDVEAQSDRLGQEVPGCGDPGTANDGCREPAAAAALRGRAHAAPSLVRPGDASLRVTTPPMRQQPSPASARRPRRPERYKSAKSSRFLQRKCAISVNRSSLHAFGTGNSRRSCYYRRASKHPPVQARSCVLCGRIREPALEPAQQGGCRCYPEPPVRLRAFVP